MDKPIQIPVGNDCTLKVKAILKDGTAVPASALTDVAVKMTTAHKTDAYTHAVLDGAIVIPLGANMRAGEYDVHITAKLGESSVAMNRKALFARCLFDNGVEATEYAATFVIIAEGADSLEELKRALEYAVEDYRNAAAEALAQKERFEDAVEDIEDMAKETTSQAILTKVSQGVTVDLSPVTGMLKNSKGENLITKIWDGVNGMFNTIKDFLKVAPTKTDLANLATGTAVSSIAGNVGEYDEEIGEGDKTLFAVIGRPNTEDGEKVSVNSYLFGLKTLIGKVNDGSSVYSLFGKLSLIYNFVARIGSTTDTDTSNTLWGKFAKLFGVIGTVDDDPKDDTLFGQIGFDSAEQQTLHDKADGIKAELDDSEHGLAKISQELGKLDNAEYGLEAIKNAISQGGATHKVIDFSGVTLLDGYYARSAAEFIQNLHAVVEIVDDTTSVVKSDFWLRWQYEPKYFTSLRKTTFNKAVSINSVNDLAYGSMYSLKEIVAPNTTYFNVFGGRNSMGNLRVVDMPKCVSFPRYQNREDMTLANVIKLVVGEGLNRDLDLTSFKNENCVSSSSSTLVDIDEDFDSNLEKYLYNIRTYIAANLPDRSAEETKYTIKFHSVTYNALDEETKLAFTSKGWNVSA